MINLCLKTFIFSLKVELIFVLYPSVHVLGIVDIDVAHYFDAVFVNLWVRIHEMAYFLSVHKLIWLLSFPFVILSIVVNSP